MLFAAPTAGKSWRELAGSPPPRDGHLQLVSHVLVHGFAHDFDLIRQIRKRNFNLSPSSGGGGFSARTDGGTTWKPINRGLRNDYFARSLRRKWVFACMTWLPFHLIRGQPPCS